MTVPWSDIVANENVIRHPQPVKCNWCDTNQQPHSITPSICFSCTGLQMSSLSEALPMMKLNALPSSQSGKYNTAVSCTYRRLCSKTELYFLHQHSGVSKLCSKTELYFLHQHSGVSKHSSKVIASLHIPLVLLHSNSSKHKLTHHHKVQPKQLKLSCIYRLQGIFPLTMAY